MKNIPIGGHIRIRTVHRFPAGMKWSGEANKTLRFEDLAGVSNRAQEIARLDELPRRNARENAMALPVGTRTLSFVC